MVYNQTKVYDYYENFTFYPTPTIEQNCASNNDRNQRLLRDLDAIPRVVALLKGGNENVVREAALCLKNLAQNDENNDLIGRCGGVNELVQLVETSASDSIRKVCLKLFTKKSSKEGPFEFPINESLFCCRSQRSPSRRSQNTRTTKP